MQSGKIARIDSQESLCPDLTADWFLDDQSNNTGQVILQAKVGNRRYQFDAINGYALIHFTGQYTAEQILLRCRSRFPVFIPSDLIARLLENLVELGVLQSELTQKLLPTSPEKSENYLTNSQSQVGAFLPERNELESDASSSKNSEPKVSGTRLKSSVEWIPNPDGYWILRNPEDLTFFQVDENDREILCQIGSIPLTEIAAKYEISLEELLELLRNLAEFGMLEGTKAQKPPRQFNLLKLLSFQIPLFNPDPWLTKQIDNLRWIWTGQFGFILCALMSASLSVWLAMGEEMAASSQRVFATGGSSTVLIFALLTILVISLHELGHAFTLKHYGGEVRELGLLFICLLPGGYTDTTDQYKLVRRKERVLVIGAGVLVQLAIWALSVWVWVFSKSYPLLNDVSFLLMTAALLTVVFNLNPLNKFDGYYLLVALSGVNNLRERSFQFYANLLRRQEKFEDAEQVYYLAAYAPLSIAYTVWVVGYLLSVLIHLMEQNMPSILEFTKFYLPSGS